MRWLPCKIGLVLGLVYLTPGLASAVERVRYIAADEVVWDYAPSYPNNPITGEPFTEEESVYLRSAKDRIGKRYLKAVYREYTDASFSSLKPRGPDEVNLGLLGPIIHAEVGDTITVVIRNNSRFPVGPSSWRLLREDIRGGALQHR